MMTFREFVEISVTVLFTTLTDHCALLELLINHISLLIQTPSLRTSVYWNLMIIIHLLQLGQFMHFWKNSFLPPGFNNNFSQSNQFHSYNTRNSQAYRLPYCRTNTKKFSPFFQGPKFFNSLDNEVINSPSLSSFKKRLKIKLLSKYENSS